MAAATLEEDKMHGSLFVLFKRYVENAYDYSTWVRLQEEVGLAASTYQMQQMYPTRDLVALVQGVSHLANTSAYQIMEQYGESLVPDLLLVYRKYIQPEWRTYELLLHTEATMHGAVRKEDNRTNPPVLLVSPQGPHQLLVDYHSKRRMAGVAVGIIKGIAKYYHEEEKVSLTCLTGLEEESVQLLVGFSP